MHHLLPSAHDVGVFFGGSSFAAFAAHMLATRPPTQNVWINWLIGGAQWAIGQRVSGANTVKGISSDVVASRDQPVLVQMTEAKIEKEKEKDA